MNLPACVRSHPSGAALTVWVVPGARRNQVMGLHGDALRVRVTSPAEKGRANKAVLALLEEAIGARIRLAGGAGSRRKRLVVVNVTPDELARRIGRLAN